MYVQTHLNYSTLSGLNQAISLIFLTNFEEFSHKIPVWASIIDVLHALHTLIVLDFGLSMPISRKTIGFTRHFIRYLASPQISHLILLLQQFLAGGFAELIGLARRVAQLLGSTIFEQFLKRPVDMFYFGGIITQAVLFDFVFLCIFPPAKTFTYRK